ncbi:unnamed protein product (macronuclear) [Paramecium tetraurelia]|uniref:Uncharacterized protein n=1 Tax=Paramecium tetraurelia TaxID=5888 RepID=A0C5E2_PARTE|nr:uncharacterized protein GSPATT00006508001 [Paramecium tetraurelia]CAK66009.1 unnamed protein product [Paramecium tetraurelia]|eukprot:XP_001433406.1 hypothetical protein (macronuclear) [Paramecium tetraurelia strain d4-2]
MNNQKETENDDSDKSQQSKSVQQKNKERQLRKFQKLQSLINKPFQQLTEEELNKRRILSKVSDLIGKTNNPHQSLQPLNHKFVLNIGHLQNASIPKITSNQTDPEKDVILNLSIIEKQHEQMRRQALKKQNLKENYDQLWQQEEEVSDKEIKDTYNVNKALTIVHRNQVQKEKQLKSDERLYFGKNSQSIQGNSNIQSLTNSRLILMQDQDINETECREQQARRTLKKMKTKQVINIVQQATKKIFNKKDEQIQKELIMHQVYKQMNKEKKKESIKSIDSIFRNSQNEEAFQQSQNQQKMITNKMLSENKFFQPKKLGEIKPIQSRVQLSHIIQKQETRTDDSPPRFYSRKISLINDKISNLVSQIDEIQQKETDQLTFIKQLENEQDLYKTYRESLQPDQIQDTLKSLLGPSNNNYRKPFRFNNKKFFNQIL